MMKRRGNVGHSRDGVKLNPLSFALGFITGGSIAFLILIHHVMPRDKPLHMLDHIDISTSKNSIASKKEASTNVKKIDGWHPINVFYGEESGLGSPPGRKWFAQVHQDEILIDLIGPNGYFIDLASNDAMEFSNTLALERHGWGGVCIEPNPAYWYGLSHRKCTVIGALVGATKEKVSVKFRGVYGGIVGKMDERLANRKKEPDAILEQRFTAPLIQVLQNFQVPTVIDYLSLDVEGAEYLIMKDFPFSQYLIKIMTVERPSQELRQLLEDHGYVFLKELAWWGETLWAHQSTGFTAEHPKIKSIKTEERN